MIFICLIAAIICFRVFNSLILIWYLSVIQNKTLIDSSDCGRLVLDFLLDTFINSYFCSVLPNYLLVFGYISFLLSYFFVFFFQIHIYGRHSFILQRIFVLHLSNFLQVLFVLNFNILILVLQFLNLSIFAPYFYVQAVSILFRIVLLDLIFVNLQNCILSLTLNISQILLKMLNTLFVLSSLSFLIKDTLI